MLTEEEFDFARSAFAAEAFASGKLHQVVIRERLTFARAFEYAGNAGLSGKTVVLANSDIYFDESLAKIPLDMSGRAFALMRWEMRANVSRTEFRPRVDAQDAWIFEGGLLLPLASFEMGRLRCDNRLVQILKDSGIRVSNPAIDIRSFHVQEDTRRSYRNKDAVPGSIAMAPLSICAEWA